jgi:hypothetical protein
MRQCPRTQRVYFKTLRPLFASAGMRECPRTQRVYLPKHGTPQDPTSSLRLSPPLVSTPFLSSSSIRQDTAGFASRYHSIPRRRWAHDTIRRGLGKAGT